ncbi:NACHT and WD repeat domain-containing protein, partial [Amycolatopsis sp. NPDC088138]|uniref:NACHT and WD repeat domain-containing protein n=1 Tax=Amycolatopsis sp. NPDC088138 TaxID=3363938 RepID=UPI0037FA239E
MRLDTTSRYPVDQGFSGGGLWCPDYDAVVAVVGEANARGDGQALTLLLADQFLPEDKIVLLAGWSVRSSGEIAQQAWGWRWTLASDKEADRHWRPRSRGVMSVAERGHRFRGRTTALQQIVSWLVRPASDRPVQIVTGSPGAGKSAVLGRIVVTADGEAEDLAPEMAVEESVQAPVGSVACAVHVKGKTALEVAQEIARSASARLPQEAAELPAILAAVLAGRASPFTLVLDALDEASDPDQARIIVRDVLLPLVAGRGHANAQILVGTRRFDADGDLLRVFGSRVLVIDLDSATYFDVDDLAAYAQATLQLLGSERFDNPYQSDDVAEPVARRIAVLAEQNFLVAGLVARTHGLYDSYPIAVDELQFTPSVQDALFEFLRHLPQIDGVSPVDLLTGLAYIDAPGVPISLWRVAVHALLGHAPTHDQLREFASTSAANFLVEATHSNDPVYRLFHQALNETLADRSSPIEDQAAIARAFISYGRELGWHSAPAYLRRMLPSLAQRSGLVDELLTDVDFTLHADLRRLIHASSTASERARSIVSLLHRTPAAIDADPGNRLALFSVTEALDALDTGYRRHPGPAPYRAQWAKVAPRAERSILTAHATEVVGVCAVQVDGQNLLASASNDHTVRLWDPTTGEEIRQFAGHTNRVRAVCAVQVDGQNLLASASNDHTVRLWDPTTGREIRQLAGHANEVVGVCAVQVDGRELITSASSDHTVRLWDPNTGENIRTLTGHTNIVLGVCAVQVDGRDLLASTSDDHTVRLWDPTTGAEVRKLTGHLGRMFGVCAVRVDGCDLLASASDKRTIRLWDPTTGKTIRQLTGHTNWVVEVCAVQVDGRNLLASASDDRTVRLWDPATGEEIRRLSGHTNRVRDVCAVRVDGRDLIASASEDRTVRLWDPDIGAEVRKFTGHTNRVRGVCAVRVDGRDLLTSASNDQTVRLWDPATG